jgi:hypothetical protein
LNFFFSFYSWKEAREALQFDARLKDLGKEKKNWSGKDRKTIKTKFSTFNSQVEEMFNAQKGCFIPDLELKKIIRTDTKALLMDSYTKFFDT